MMAAQAPTKDSTLILRTAAVWGTSVVAVAELSKGSSLTLGDSEGALIAKPEGCGLADVPIRAVGQGWELDARGATGGQLLLRGRDEDPVLLARSGAPIPIVAGDHGLLQYANFSVFFQFSQAPPVMKHRHRLDYGLVLSFVFALVAVLGGLALIWAITTPAGIPKPLELTSQAELAKQFNLKTQLDEPEPEVAANAAATAKGAKDSSAKHIEPSGGGKPQKGPPGVLGKQGSSATTELRGEPTSSLGGMAEVLASDVGEEVAKALGTISSVRDALGGLRSDQIVLGRGSGAALKGSGAHGGGTGEGVPFGSGTLDTGWGAGKAGPGGLAGSGKGASGDAAGTGGNVVERRVQGADAPKAGTGLTQAQISRVVYSRMGAFRACYESAVARDPKLTGTVTVSWSITSGGSVAGASIGNSSLSNGRVEGCVLRQVKRLRFPVADKPTNAAFPFVFRPSAK